MHRVGVPKLGSNHLSRPGGGKPERAADLVAAHVLREQQLERTSQHGRAGFVALGQADRERIEYDIQYIERWSFWLDLKIIAMTVSRVLFDRNAY